MELTKLKKMEDRFEVVLSPEAAMVDKINDALFWGAQTHLKLNGFSWIDVPNMTNITGACENVNTLYSVDHFGKTAFLAQTGQLYLEAKIPLHNKVWTVITSSRAEADADARHLNQFKLIEFEHRGDLDFLLQNIESTIKAMFVGATTNCREELEEIDRLDEILDWIVKPFGRITYTEAVNLILDAYIKNHSFDASNVKWGEDLGSENEAELVEMHNNRPLFITHYPQEIKFFNMRVNREDNRVVNSCDLILPYAGESVGSAEREEDYNILLERLKVSDMFKMLSEQGRTLEDFQEYLNLVKKHPILHSGCGIGFNRVSQSVLGIDDIRGTTPYPLQSNTLF